MSSTSFNSSVFKLNNNGAVARNIYQNINGLVNSFPNGLWNSPPYNNEYLYLGNSNAIKPDGSSSITYSAWVMLTNMDTAPGCYAIIVSGGVQSIPMWQQSPGYAMPFLGPYVSSNVCLYLYFGANGSDQQIAFGLNNAMASVPVSFQPFEWHHVAITYAGGQPSVGAPNGYAPPGNGYGTSVTFYIDGVAKVATISNWLTCVPVTSVLEETQWGDWYGYGPATSFSSPTTLVGSFNTGPDAYASRGRWPGYIGPFTIWNTVLSAQQIEEYRWLSTSALPDTTNLLYSDISGSLGLEGGAQTVSDVYISDNEQKLYVPVALEALMVNDIVLNTTSFNRTTINYQDVLDFKNQDPAFNTTGSIPPEKGIYLHWAIPDGLTHGVRNQSGTIDFPLVPNRWLVVRYSSGMPLNTTSWVIESDYLDPVAGSNSYIDPFASTAQVTRIGRSMPLSSWQEQNTNKLFLKATGPDGITFAAWQPGVNNVFSFFDNTIITPSDPDPTLYYLVVGWYSDANEDPLSRQFWSSAEEWQQLMEALRWQVEFPNTVLNLPSNCIFHGMTMAIPWQNTVAPAPAFTPGAQPGVTSKQLIDGFNLAIANTSVEALAALIKKELPASANASPALLGMLSEYLEAFQYNFLRDVDSLHGKSEMNSKLFQESFSKVKGGVLFEATEDGIITDSNNQAMRQYETALWNQETAGWQNFAIWWMQNYLKNNTVVSGMTASDISSFTNYLNSIANSAVNNPPFQQFCYINLNGTMTLTSQSSNASDTLYTMTGAKTYADTPFWEPMEPVLMISGAGRSNKHGDDGRYNENGNLTCRYTFQLVRPLSQYSITSSSPVLLNNPQPVTTTALPNGVSDILNEVPYFIPYNLSEFVISSPFTDTQISDINTLSSDLSQFYTYFTGSLPSPMAYVIWSQAWAPLFLDWEINWLQTPLDKMNLWEFDGNFDFNFTGTSSDLLAPVIFRNRTLITPQAINVFGSTLSNYIANNALRESSGQEAGTPAADAALATNIASVTAWLQDLSQQDLISQSLGSINDQLVNRCERLAVWPQGGSVQYYGNKTGIVPIFDLPNGNTSPWFYPIRAGFFYFSKLQLVDCFGQTLDLLQTLNPTTPPNNLPAIGRGLNTDLSIAGSPYAIKQSPRMVQPSKIEFNLVDSTNDTQLVKLVQAANPVCGFLLPNHLDKSLMFYDQAGQPLGQVAYVVSGTSSSAIWLPAPGSATPITAAVDIPDAHLRNIALGLVNTSTNGGDNLQQLLLAIDSTLWTIDPLGTKADEGMSVLIGRPLAVVRASLQYQQQGLPYLPQNWQAWNNGNPLPDWQITNLWNGLQPIGNYPLRSQIPDVTGITIDVKLGNSERKDDGLLGYWNAGCTQFNAAYEAGSTASATTSYIAPIASGNYLQVSLDPSQQTFVTMLLDPRGKVHAYSGMLPIETMSIPNAFIQSAIEAMAVTFNVGPVLTSTGAVSIPTPNVNSGNWQWLQKGDPNWSASAGIWVTTNVDAALQEPQLDNVPDVIKQGWITLNINVTNN